MKTIKDGTLDRSNDGKEDEVLDGNFVDGISDGLLYGTMNANSDGLTDGSLNKNADGAMEGVSDGLLDDSIDRISDGLSGG